MINIRTYSKFMCSFRNKKGYRGIVTRLWEVPLLITYRMFQCCIVFWRLFLTSQEECQFWWKLSAILNDYFMIFFNLCIQITEYFLKLHHSHLLKNAFHFAIRELSYYSKLLDNVSVINCQVQKVSSSRQFSKALRMKCCCSVTS